VFALVTMAASLVFLAQALKTIPVGTGYAVWIGIGAVDTAMLGIVLFLESTNPGRTLSLALIVAGTIGLKLTHGGDIPD
jgi:quaternary ammonium compound-resistance protein SugE